MPPYTKDKPSTIQSMFDNIANRYDTGNAVLSFQLHRIWNAALIKQVLLPKPPEKYLDLCCGTGDIAFGYLKKQRHTIDAILLDFSSEMLARAREKAKAWGVTNHAITYVQADAQQIPLPDSSVDAVTIAYGLRNVQNPSRCVQEVYRVLKPGGRFGILELTRPSNSLLRWGHHLYLKMLLPRVAGWITSDSQAYHYLCQSIHQFMSPEQMKQLLNDACFRSTWTRGMCGGIATIVAGQKSLEQK